ncbi:type II toxin-antitoxin system RelE/ParE family toxin [Methylovirgula sp. 4M-Z18]|uniref:type II toxin-antitoxin system RelE/ParE family toxin n=1 Tax=Methylovirgula sp. 4M-Z18 TaxID=2293567 RepID=UPI001FE1E0D6|nr:type II toxin-antitoxin system RelE/ParE family toxin [Methylovirgula sp. 4M-Z18]
MTKEDRRTVGSDVKTVEFGWPIGMPICRNLGDGLWEVRSDLSDGTIGRVIFAIIGGDMVLLEGFHKTSDKTPKRNLDNAKKRLKELVK